MSDETIGRIEMSLANSTRTFLAAKERRNFGFVMSQAHVTHHVCVVTRSEITQVTFK
jgi:hypothetical protein